MKEAAEVAQEMNNKEVQEVIIVTLETITKEIIATVEVLDKLLDSKEDNSSFFIYKTSTTLTSNCLYNNYFNKSK